MTVNYHGNAVDITFSIGDTTAPITLIKLLIRF